MKKSSQMVADSSLHGDLMNRNCGPRKPELTEKWDLFTVYAESVLLLTKIFSYPLRKETTKDAW